MELNMTANQRSRIKRRIDAINALGGRCIECGIKDWQVLEFDHIVPMHTEQGTIKVNGQHNTNEINRMVKDGLDPKVKFQLLCCNDHRKKTYANQDFIRATQ
jgi:hypothetical protein